MTTTFSYPQYAKPVPRCTKCLKTISDTRQLKQPICGAIYCPRCICQIYQPNYLLAEPDIIIQMYCSHFMDKEVVEEFVKGNCINCGNRFDQKIDLQMKGGVKLCKYCFDYHADKYRDYLFQCMSCNRIIRALNFLAETQIVLCRDCAATQSNLQSNIIKNEEKEDFPYNPKKDIKKEVPDFKKEHKKPIAVKREESLQSDQNEEISVVSRFSGLSLGSDKDADKEPHKKKTKVNTKHSIQIRVQNLQLEIPIQKNIKNKCSVCRCMVADDGLIQGEKGDFQCKMCFMNDTSSSKETFNRNLLRPSTERNQRNQITSAPKKKTVLLERPQDVRVMKKSFVFGDTSSTLLHGLTTLDLNKSSTSTTSTNSLQVPQHSPTPTVWTQPQIDAEKLCQICQLKRYMIIRPDKKKVCSGCYSKP